jgi:hypothetical protein
VVEQLFVIQSARNAAKRILTISNRIDSMTSSVCWLYFLFLSEFAFIHGNFMEVRNLASVATAPMNRYRLVVNSLPLDLP